MAMSIDTVAVRRGYDKLQYPVMCHLPLYASSAINPMDIKCIQTRQMDTHRPEKLPLLPTQQVIKV